MPSLPSAALLVVSIAACSEAVDPIEADALQYVSSMTPLMEDNRALAEQFQVLAMKIKQAETNPEQMATDLHDNLIPRAQTLYDQADSVSPGTPSLALTHASLAKAWRDRTAAWTDAHAAFGDADLESFDQAMARLPEIRQAEEYYIVDVNAFLYPYGQALTLYPRPGADSQ